MNNDTCWALAVTIILSTFFAACWGGCKEVEKTSRERIAFAHEENMTWQATQAALVNKPKTSNE